jgi:hypothetical protein
MQNCFTVFLFLVLTSLAYSQTSPQNVECDKLAEHVRLSLNSEAQTLGNVVKYMNDNSQNWYNMDSIVSRAFRDASFRRNNSYTGAAYTEGQKSAQNAQKMQSHKRQLEVWRDQLVEQIAKCLVK